MRMIDLLQDRAKALAYGLLLVLAFASGWTVSNWKADARIARIELGQVSEDLRKMTQAAINMSKTQKGFDDALQTFQGTQQDNAKAQQDLGRVLLDIRGIAAGLRGDFAGLPARIERASSAALGQYATTCSAVFEDLAREIGTLAEDGAAIAQQAEGHAADARMIQDAWPKQ